MDKNIELKLERLKELESKVEKIQTSNRQRVKKFMDKRKQAGMVQVSALISRQAYEIINNRRDKSIKAGMPPETTSTIIEQALMLLDSSVNINVNIKQDKTKVKAQDKDKAVPEPPPAEINLFNEPQKQEQQAIEIPPPEPLSTLQVEPQAATLDITTMPDKAIDMIGFRTWLYTQIKVLKAGGYSCTNIAMALNKAGVKTVKNKEFNNKNVERFFNRE